MLRLPAPVDARHLFDIDYLTEPGQEAFARGLSNAAQALVPNRPMKISEWSKRIRLPSQTSPRGGLFTPINYQVELLDVQQEPGVDVIALMGVPRIGKTTIPLVSGSYYNTWEGDDVLFVEVSKESLQVLDHIVLAEGYAALQLLKEKDPNIRAALNKPPGELSEPYKGPDSSHRSDAHQADILVYDDRVTNTGKAKLIDKPVSAAAALGTEVQHDAELEKKHGGLVRKSGGLQVRSGLQLGPSGRLRYGGKVKSRSF